ncbi:MAG: hypothetical protein JO097_08335 [Acidobacteriaceae bacterium]|nr:hypothetical protein [Acidobacteriaceae bacterium]MBV9766388.1 hypothetical protein [Acidobacteriaceae bacterium]
MSRNFALWTGILAGPIVWLLSFEAIFALAPWACVFQAKLALYLVSLVALALAAGSGLLAWREWSALGKELPGDGEGALPRSRVMAIGGVLLSAMFFLVILAQAIPELLLGACE